MSEMKLPYELWSYTGFSKPERFDPDNMIVVRSGTILGSPTDVTDELEEALEMLMGMESEGRATREDWEMQLDPFCLYPSPSREDLEKANVNRYGLKAGQYLEDWT